MKTLITIIFLSFAITISAQDSANKIFLELVNAHRAKHGLKPVEYSALLDSAATLHVNWMVAANKLSHYESPLTPEAVYYVGPLERIKKFAGIENFDTRWRNHFYSVFENAGFLTCEHINRESITQMFNLWVSSSRHNKALLDPKVNIAAFNLHGNYNSLTKRYSVYSACLLVTKL
jgi:uncharacterized protein YkwD